MNPILNLKQLDFYSSKCLKVVTNTGKLVDYNFNTQQALVHQQIEEQKSKTGKVRVIILKSRKLGMSTYAAARFIHSCSLQTHKRAAVVTHVADSTAALFRVYKRFFDNLPIWIKPPIKRNNQKELEFDTIDSSIKVATAGSAETGRGDTVHYLHCSEIGFWPNAREIAAGLMRSVADVSGTEIIIESTASTKDTLFYDMWTDAVAGLNGYLPIFLPWTVDPQCSTPVPDNHSFSNEELSYQQLHKLSDEQLYWRKQTIRQLGEQKFKNEYPITAIEAFASIETDSYIKQDDVISAMKRELHPNAYKNMPLILGVDVAAMGADKTCFVWRRGDYIEKYKLFEKLKNEEVADQLMQVMRTDNPKKVFIDSTGGYGAGVASIMRLRGYQLEEINFGSKATNDDYANKRAEMYANLKEWISREVSIPDDTLLEQDLLSTGFKHNISGQLQMESKAEIKKRLSRSPDIADAVALTFAYQIGEDLENSDWTKMRDRNAMYEW